ncbi:MAG: nodulation protein NfeD [Proteobacteria bacterium]|nr:nodulation protein NfeD [Pseudomonadota bacterium]
MQRKKKANKQVRLRRLPIIYGIVAIVGFGLGQGTSSYGAQEGKSETPQQETLKKVFRALEKIVEESSSEKDMGSEVDAGTGAGPKASVKAFAPSPESDEYLKWQETGELPEYRRLPEPDKNGGKGKTVIIVHVDDIIDMGLSAFIGRAIQSNPKASALIMDINTPGGRVDAATEIRDAIMEAPKTLRTVAFINPRAISAGAFISFACDLIFISKGGSIGAATPISLGGSGEAQPVGEKMVSYFRTEMAATARAKGRRGDIAEAMVDNEIEIKGISPAGKLLTLDTAGALRWKIADRKANSLDEVLEYMALGGAERKVLALNWAEKVARVFTHPILSGILMSIGVLGILIELYQPGFGLPGIAGITCLIIFFMGHLVVNLAGWEEVLLFALGVGLLAVELFVTPGFGVIGATGIMAIIGSLVLALTALPMDVSFQTGMLTSSILRVLLSMGIVLILFFAAFAILPRTKIRNVLILDAAIKGTSRGGREGVAISEVIESGESGVAESFLRPAGIARFGSRRIDVMSEGDFIDRGEKVVIVRVEGNRVIVRKEEEC